MDKSDFISILEQIEDGLVCYMQAILDSSHSLLEYELLECKISAIIDYTSSLMKCYVDDLIDDEWEFKDWYE